MYYEKYRKYLFEYGESGAYSKIISELEEEKKEFSELDFIRMKEIDQLRARCERLEAALKNICSFFSEDSHDFAYTIAKQALEVPNDSRDRR